jgi:hypothetical protein
LNQARIVLLLIASCGLFTSNARSQVVPARTPAPVVAVFGTFSAEKLGAASDTAQYGNFVSGVTLGGFAQFRPWLGLEARGGVLRIGNDLHRNTALIGPRAVLYHHRFRFDGNFLVGLSHAGLIKQPPVIGYEGRELVVASWNTAFEIAGGVDYRLTRRLYWKIGDIGYNHILTQQGGANGITFSSGLVVRLF